MFLLIFLNKRNKQGYKRQPIICLKGTLTCLCKQDVTDRILLVEITHIYTCTHTHKYTLTIGISCLLRFASLVIVSLPRATSVLPAELHRDYSPIEMCICQCMYRKGKRLRSNQVNKNLFSRLSNPLWGMLTWVKALQYIWIKTGHSVPQQHSKSDFVLLGSCNCVFMRWDSWMT